MLVGKSIAITSGKGGTLKTSLATNIGGVLARAGKKVCIIEVDQQGNVATSFGINPDTLDLTVYDVLVKRVNTKDVVITVVDNLDIIPANEDMAYFEMDVLTSPDKYKEPLQLMKEPLNNLKNNYDFVIIDTPPQMGMLLANVLNCVDEVLLPYHPEVYAFRSMVKSIEAVTRFKDFNKNLMIKSVVPVKVKSTLTHRAYLQSAEAYCVSNGLKFSEIEIPETIKYAESIGRYKLPLTLLDSSADVIANYAKLYTDLTIELGYLKEGVKDGER